MHPASSRVVTTFVIGLLVAACTTVTSPAPTPTSAPTPPPASGSPVTTTHPTLSPPAANEPTRTPIAVIDHATGSTDIVLRFDSGFGDYGICELCGGWGEFSPGPEFTLYGDETVVFRNERAQPRAERLILRSVPFRIGRLDEEQVQSLLQFALGEGGLANARDRYDTATDTDDPGYSIFIARAGGLDKRVEIGGSNSPFGSLADHLRNLDRGGDIPTQVWVPDRYWGLLIEVSSWIEVGVLPGVPDTEAAHWPWPGIAPWVSGTALDPREENPRRVMSQAEAAVLGLSDNGGVVQRIYLLGPDGETIYSFSLWPILPHETR